MGVQTARSLTPHKRRRAVALANGHYESIIMTVGISRYRATETKDAAFQIAKFSAKISLHSRPYLQSVQRPPSPHLPPHTSNFPHSGDGGMASRDIGSVIRSGSEFRLVRLKLS